MARRYGDVDFVAGGKTYTVRYGNLAWDELKRKLGAATEVGCLLKARESPKGLQVLLREGLAAYHPELTPADVRELYDELPGPEGGRGLNAAAWEAVSLALPELKQIAEGSGPKGGPAPARPTRRRSSAKR